MKLHIEMLRNSQAIGNALRKHGWYLHKAGASSYSAEHPEVVDQATARHQLYVLGLLTSPDLRIQFAPTHGRSTLAGR